MDNLRKVCFLEELPSPGSGVCWFLAGPTVPMDPRVVYNWRNQLVECFKQRLEHRSLKLDRPVFFLMPEDRDRRFTPIPPGEQRMEWESQALDISLVVYNMCQHPIKPYSAWGIHGHITPSGYLANIQDISDWVFYNSQKRCCDIKDDDGSVHFGQEVMGIQTSRLEGWLAQLGNRANYARTSEALIDMMIDRTLKEQNDTDRTLKEQQNDIIVPNLKELIICTHGV